MLATLATGPCEPLLASVGHWNTCDRREGNNNTYSLASLVAVGKLLALAGATGGSGLWSRGRLLFFMRRGGEGEEQQAFDGGGKSA